MQEQRAKNSQDNLKKKKKKNKVYDTKELLQRYNN